MARAHSQKGLSVSIGISCAALVLWVVTKLQRRSLSSTAATSRTKQHVIVHNSQPQTAEAAAHEARMRHVYTQMGEDFADKGLDLVAIRAIQPWFHGVEGDALPWPKQYSQLEDPLPAHAVRLLVVPFEESPGLVAAASAATAEVAALLPQGTKLFMNSRTQYHCTVFHTSYPTDVRPDALAHEGGVPDHTTPSHLRRGPTESELRRETRALARVVAHAQRPVLELERVVMTRTGTLLITWVDRSGALSTLRAALHKAFPGACTRQATIIHTTLLRVVDVPEQLPPGVIDEVNEACARWTAKLAGRTSSPSVLWWVHESEFSTITGDRMRLPIGVPPTADEE